MAKETKLTPAGAPAAELKAARLVYVSDTEAGITRHRRGKWFSYRDPVGQAIRVADVLQRIRALAIPPAYIDVWICAKPNGHLQATGIDQRGRKQYRYHPRWRAVRDESKFERMAEFAAALPKIRRRVKADLSAPGLIKTKVLAAVVFLLETTLIRVGNDRYAEANKSFGLTTLRKRHADVAGSEIRFAFRAKSGKEVEVDLKDRRLAKIVRSCQDLPGQRLFQYTDENGVHQTIDSNDVNGYLQEIAGQDFTAKDFRTWAATRLAVQALAAQPAAESEIEAKRIVADCVKAVAGVLGNTPAVCRKSYIHPGVITAYAEGKLAAIGGNGSRDPARPVRREAVLKLLSRIAA